MCAAWPVKRKLILVGAIRGKKVAISAMDRSYGSQFESGLKKSITCYEDGVHKPDESRSS